MEPKYKQFSITKRLESSKKLTEKNKENIRENLKALQQKVEEKGKKDCIRDDSKLAFYWACGKVEKSIDDIAQDIVATDWLYANTPYDEVSQKLVQYVLYDLQTQYGLTYKQSMKIIGHHWVPIVRNYFLSFK